MEINITKEEFIKHILTKMGDCTSKITFGVNCPDITEYVEEEDLKYILRRVYKDKNINNIYLCKTIHCRTGELVITAEKIEKIDHKFLSEWERYIVDFPNDSYGVVECCSKWNYIQKVIGNEEDIIDLQNEFMIYKLLGGKLSWNE